MKMWSFIVFMLVLAVFTSGVPAAGAGSIKRRLASSVSPEEFMEISSDTAWKSMMINANEIKETCPNDTPLFASYIQGLLKDIVQKYGSDAYWKIVGILNDDLTIAVRIFMYLEGKAGGNIENLGSSNTERVLEDALKESHIALDGFFGSAELLFSHGRDLENYTMLWQTIFWLKETSQPDFTEEESQTRAKEVQQIIETTIGYDHPILTLRVVSACPDLFDDDDNEGIIVVGEGMYEFYQTLPAKQMSSLTGFLHAHAHEYGHLRQCHLGLRKADDVRTPSTTRKFELMADASSSYFLRHPAGGKMSLESICEVYNHAFGTGDCHFEKDGHHGTPAQRQCAAIWGANQVSQSLLNSPKYVMTGRKSEIEFVERFEAVVDRILELDPEICPFPQKGSQVEETSLKANLRQSMREQRQSMREQRKAEKMRKREERKNKNI